MGSGSQSQPAGPSDAAPRSITPSTGVIEAYLRARFDRVTLIAQSGASLVFSGVQRSTGRTIALKVFPDRVLDQEPSSNNEVRAHGAMSWHPNVATLFDAGLTPANQLWMSLEYAPTTLAARLKRHPLDAAELLGIARELMSAVAAMHAQSIVHCDLKPSNVLLAADGSARVTDFGIAELLDITPPTLDVARGTLQYISPEVLEGACPTTASDVWGVGITLWAAAHGRIPFGDDGQPLASIVSAAIGGLPAWAPPAGFQGLEADRLRDVIELCTARDPNTRPTASEARAMLARPLRVTTIVEAPRAAPIGRSRLMALCAIISVVAVIGGALLLRNEGRGAPTLLNSTAGEWCQAVRQGDTDIGKALDRASQQIVNGDHSAVAMRAALRELPIGIGAATWSWRRILAVEPHFNHLAPALTETRLRDYIVAETTTYLATGQFIPGTATGSVRAGDNVPATIAETANAFGKVSEETRTLCGSEATSWRDQQIRLIDEVRASLEGPDSPFFDDPTSPTALDAELLATVIATQENYFVKLLVDHPDWAIRATADGTGSPAITNLLAGPGAHAFRKAVLASYPLATYLARKKPLLASRVSESLPDDQRQEFLDEILQMSDSHR